MGYRDELRLLSQQQTLLHHFESLAQPRTVTPIFRDTTRRPGAPAGMTARRSIPDNITLLALPSYSPELNPVERIWHYLRSHWLANSVFRSLADIMDACEMAWNRFAADPNLIRSLCAVAWVVG